MKPTDCVRQARKFLGEEHTTSILAKAQDYRGEGLDARAAMTKAVQDHLADVRAEMKAPKAAVAAAKPDKGAGEQSIDQQIAARLAVEQPDLQVVLPGVEGQMPLSEAMVRIAETQKQDAQWADLVQVATECALAG